jgi:phosphoribosylanthranilate isomerase
VQLHGAESEETAHYVAERVRTVIRAFPASSDRVRQFDAEGHDYLLLDGEDPGSGLAHGWDVFERHVFRTPVIASGGLTPASVGAVVANYPVWGVDVSSGVESAPGIKDPGLVADFIANARWAADTRPEDFDDRPFDWSEQ